MDAGARDCRRKLCVDRRSQQRLWRERKAYYLLAGSSGDNGSEIQLMRWSEPVSSAPEVLEADDFARWACATIHVVFDEGTACRTE
jgi:hypothetical protein